METRGGDRSGGSSPTRFVLTPRMIRVAAWAGAIALAAGMFLLITHETITEGRGVHFDSAILLWFARQRTPGLTAVMIDLTALGSSTLVALFTAVTFAILLVLRDRRAALHLVAATAGTWILTSVTKNHIEKARPTVVEHLVSVSGFSYPSGHSLSAAALYLTIAIVASGHLTSVAGKAVLITSASLIVGLVAVSRVYLGVHTPSDVVSGVCLGAAWALVLAAGVAAMARRAHPRG